MDIVNCAKQMTTWVYGYQIICPETDADTLYQYIQLFMIFVNSPLSFFSYLKHL